jgi:hypothetical protein
MFTRLSTKRAIILCAQTGGHWVTKHGVRFVGNEWSHYKTANAWHWEQGGDEFDEAVAHKIRGVVFETSDFVCIPDR